MQNVLAETWYEDKDKHFIIHYTENSDRDWARRVLRRAEKYYNSIADEIGYTRYHKFWTWEDRVHIVAFKDKETFTEKTGLPEWSRGGATRDLNLFQTKVIVTYKQEDGFLDGVLPHEISHLILKDFIGFDRDIPIWFDEGVAQLQEEEKRNKADYLMRDFIKEGKYIPLPQLMHYDVRRSDDPKVVGLFYVQSISVINFMISRYGSTRFGQMCRYLRDGQDFTEALKKSYISLLDSLEELQEKWIKNFSY